MFNRKDNRPAYKPSICCIARLATCYPNDVRNGPKIKMPKNVPQIFTYCNFPVTTFAKTCRHGKEEMRQYGKRVFSLTFVSWNEGDIYKIWTEVFFVDWGGGRDGAKRKQQHPDWQRRKKFNENLSACAYFWNKALEEKLNNWKRKPTKLKTEKDFIYNI